MLDKPTIATRISVLALLALACGSVHGARKKMPEIGTVPPLINTDNTIEHRHVGYGESSLANIVGELNALIVKAAQTDAATSKSELTKNLEEHTN